MGRVVLDTSSLSSKSRLMKVILTHTQNLEDQKVEGKWYARNARNIAFGKIFIDTFFA